MAYIPSDAIWYLADIVEKISVEDDARSVFHFNLTLIQAMSPEEAYSKAIALGKRGEITYENPEGKSVRFEFFGLRDLFVIPHGLEDGEEILYTEEIGISDDEVRNRLPTKDRLSVFKPREPSSGPNYISKQVLTEALKLTRESD